MKILIIGGGNMGTTYARSFLHAHIVEHDNMMILEKSPEKVKSLTGAGIGIVFSDPAECLSQADLIILAVKPQDTQVLFDRLKPMIEPQQVFLSIMAGVKMQSIAQALSAPKIIRAMPNLPAQIGLGMTAYTATPEVTRIELVMVQNLLNTTGKAVYVEDESLIDAATAISGSGPAYVWFFMQSLMEAAHKMGFSHAEAELLVGQTFRGAVDLLDKTDFSCEEWIQRVCSRGGTTEAALKDFREKEVYKDIISGANAALNRAIELGKG